VESYDIDELADDVECVVRACGKSQAVVIGHDLGGGVAWNLGSRRDGVVDKLVVVASPRTNVFFGYLWRHPVALFMNAYVLLFQLRWLADMVFLLAQWMVIPFVFWATARKNGVPRDLVRKYTAQRVSQVSVAGLLNWYRARWAEYRRGRIDTHVGVDTLVLWGDHDVSLPVAMAELSAKTCDVCELRIIDGAGHWLHHEEMEKCLGIIQEFIRSDG
jgi:pimeloyl-ACP methyl ester carboxylesterase